MDLAIRCACGVFRGTLREPTPGRGNRVVCYCADCQAFARFLGCADRVLDRHGGTDIFQTSPARLAFGAGRERLACLRLTPRGLLRWYASCCRTPLGNTPGSAQIPFVGLILACVEDAGPLGPVRAHVHTASARGGGDAPRERVHEIASSVARFAGLTLLARLRGDQRRSPFFDPESGETAVAPYVLSAEEWAASRPEASA